MPCVSYNKTYRLASQLSGKYQHPGTPAMCPISYKRQNALCVILYHQDLHTALLHVHNIAIL